MSPVLKVKLPDGTFADIAGTGQVGPSGGPVPTGGEIGQTIVKTGVADFEVGWQAAGRGFVGQLMGALGASVPGGAANTWTNIMTGDITMYDDRMYQISAGIRCISDAGASCNMNVALTGNAIGVLDDYVTTSGSEVSLWGAWSQLIVQPGSLYVPVGGGAVAFILKIKLSVANLTCYLPRVTVIDVGSV